MTVLRPSSASSNRDSARLKFWTNVSLLVAIGIGMAVAAAHGGHQATTISWAGASLAAGGLLGFLFGIPGKPNQNNVQINQPGVATVGAGIGAATGQGGDPQTQPLEEGGGAGAPPPAAPVSVTTQPIVNQSDSSNLEQVSDWVTKLLLGGGLTQLQQIPGMISSVARRVALGISLSMPPSEAELRSEQAFAASVLIYFFIAGFFGGYLITKLQLSRELS